MIHFLILRCILMLSLVIAVAISASIIRAVSTLNESRLKPQYFTRKRKLPFHDLLKFLLSCSLMAFSILVLLSPQAPINALCKFLGNVTK